MKTLYESILNKSGVGKIYLIQKWLDEHGIKNYTINSKEEVDVDGSVNLSNCGLVEFPSFIQFGTIKGNFNCSNNELTSLKGSPEKVKGYFHCSFNNLTTLEGAPKKVGDDFYCRYNHLTSLEGAPKVVRGIFVCKHNKTQFTEGDVKKVCKVKREIIA